MKKYIFTVNFAICFILCSFICLAEQVEVTTTGTIAWSVQWQGMIYTGTYTGELLEVYPHGYGEFEGSLSDENTSDAQIKYSGKWKEGKIHGKGILVDETTGITYEGKFSEGTLNGTFKQYTENDDTSYVISNYSKDLPCNIQWVCDADGNYNACDGFLKGQRVSSLYESANEFSYRDLLYEETLNKYHKIKLSCNIIKQVNKVMNDVLWQFLLVEDEDGNRYILKCSLRYGNVAANYMPFVQIGDKIEAFGHYMGLSSIDGEDLEAPCIEVQLIRWTDKDNFDPLNMTYSYADFLNYPYAYKNEIVELYGKLTGICKSEEKWVYCLIESNNYSGENKDVYFLKVQNTPAKLSNLPLPGEDIAVRGKLDLVDKIGDEENGYVFYPIVEMKKILQ